jgi:hypothetical protein
MQRFFDAVASWAHEQALASVCTNLVKRWTGKDKIRAECAVQKNCLTNAIHQQQSVHPFNALICVRK